MSLIAESRLAPKVSVGDHFHFRPVKDSSLRWKISITRTADGMRIIAAHEANIMDCPTVESILALVALMNILLETDGLELAYAGAADLTGSLNHPGASKLMSERSRKIGPGNFFREMIFLAKPLSL